MSLYVTTLDINELQIKILRFANDWARTRKTPISKQELISQMERQKENGYGVTYALDALIRKHYISRIKVYGEGSKTFYRVLRTI